MTNSFGIGRWSRVFEQAHQQLKEELGLDHFEGRFPGVQLSLLLVLRLLRTWLPKSR